MKKATIVLSFVLVFGSAAFADTTQSATKATALLASSCRFNASDVFFGDYDPSASEHLLATQATKFTCTKGTTFTIATADGSGASKKNEYGILAQMKSSGNILYFQVFNPVANFWNDDIDGANGSTLLSEIGTGNEETMTLQYRVIKNQYVPPGNYFATNTMKLSF